MIPLSDLRERLELQPRDDQRLVGLRDAVVGLWEQETGRPWLRREDYVQTIRPRDYTRKIWLALRPVESVTKVEEILSGSDWTELDSEGWLFVEPTIEKLSSYFRRLVRVTYTGGVVAEPEDAEAKTPADIREALILQARYLVDRHSGENAILRSKAFEKGSTSFLSADLHPLFKKTAQLHARRG